MESLARTLGLQLRSLKDSLHAELAVEWLDMDFHNSSDIDDYLARALPLVDQSFDSTIEVTSAINDVQGELLLEDAFEGSPVDAGAIKSQLRYGVPPSEVYTRPFKEFWFNLSKGGSINDALASGTNRLRQLVDTDIERISDFTQIEKFANTHQVVGYRRVLVGPVNCALCIVASTQRYHKKNLKPIHPHCDCKTRPVLSFESDGDQILDQELLDQIHKDIQDKFGISDRSARAIDYRKVMVEHKHGEIGPYLSYRGNRFTGPSGIN